MTTGIAAARAAVLVLDDGRMTERRPRDPHHLGENMDYAEIRRLLLKVFIGCLSLTALLAIVSVLSGKSGETQIKVLATTFSICAGSICAMPCAGFLERKGAKGIGFTGLIATAVAVLLAIGGVWGQIPGLARWIITAYWKTTATVGVVAVALAYGCLLRLPTLAARYRWTQTVSSILIGLLAVQILVGLWGEIKEDGYYRVMAANSILVVLLSLVIPICTKLGTKAYKPAEDLGQGAKPFDQLPENLVLRKVSTGVFSDEAGRRYRVTEIGAEPGAPPHTGSADVPPAPVT